MQNDVKTTGQLRALLANALKGVINGDLDIQRAEQAQKLGKAISESLYSETKIAMFQHEIKKDIGKFGGLSLGDPDVTT